MARTIAHIGIHKTGSTAIQRAVVDSKAALLERGLLFPGDFPDHRCIAETLSSTLRRQLSSSVLEVAERRYNAVVEAMAAHDGDVLISSEGLMWVDPKVFRDWLGDADVWIVVYLREQVGYFASWYQQAVKARSETRHFADFVGDRIVDHNKFLDKWTAAFGANRIDVRIYDVGLFPGGNIAEDFFGAIGAPSAYIKGSAKQNPNPSIRGALLEAKRRINALALDAETVHKATFVPLIELANERPDLCGSMPVAPEVVSLIEERHRPSNEALAARHLNGRTLPHYAPRTPKPTTGEDDVMADLLARVEVKNPDFAQTLRERLPTIVERA